MALRALTEMAIVPVAVSAVESGEFQIPYWATHVGMLVPDVVGKDSMELYMATESGGTFAPVLNIGILKKASGDGGYFEIGPYVAGTDPDWVFKVVFGKVQATAFDITINYRGA